MQSKNMWEEVVAALQARQREIMVEIMHYPPPIPACDVQFNHLLETRAQVAQALRQVKTLQPQAGDGEEGEEQLREFVATCDFIEFEQASRWFPQDE